MSPFYNSVLLVSVCDVMTTRLPSLLNTLLSPRTWYLHSMDVVRSSVICIDTWYKHIQTISSLMFMVIEDYWNIWWYKHLHIHTCPPTSITTVGRKHQVMLSRGRMPPELVDFFPSEMKTWVKIICPSTNHPLSVVAQVLFSIAVWRGANGTRALPTLPQVGVGMSKSKMFFGNSKWLQGLTFHDLNRDILHILTDELQDGQC